MDTFTTSVDGLNISMSDEQLGQKTVSSESDRLKSKDSSEKVPDHYNQHANLFIPPD